MKHILIVTIIFSHLSYFSKGQSNPWSSHVEQTLPTYVPLPYEELMRAGQILSAREAEKSRATIKTYREYYAATKYFKSVNSGTHNVVVILGNSHVTKGSVLVIGNKVKTLSLGVAKFSSSSGLKSVSEIKDAYVKLFLEDGVNLIPVELFFTELFSDTPYTKPTESTVNTSAHSVYEVNRQAIKAISKESIYLDFTKMTIITIYDIPNLAINKSIGEVKSEDANRVRFTGEVVNGTFYKVIFDGKQGYVYKTMVGINQ